MQIWTVGGGKGGTGKSFVASGLGVCLAERGHRVVLVDADFGGANLHSYVGVYRPPRTLEDFRVGRVPLTDILVDTPIPNLTLLAGDLNATDATGLSYSQKLKFFRHIKKLDADIVLIDLGAGSRKMTVDTFLLGDRMIAVTVPEKMAIENLYQFMKNAYFRKLANLFRQVGIREAARQMWGDRKNLGIRSMDDLTKTLSNQYQRFADLHRREMGRFRIQLVLNKVREYRQTDTGVAVRSMAEKYLGIPSNFAGPVRYDREFWTRLAKEPVHISRVTAARLMVDLSRIADVLLEPLAASGEDPES